MKQIELLAKRICKVLAAKDIELCSNALGTLLLTAELAIMTGHLTTTPSAQEIREAYLRLAQMFLDKANELDEPVRH